MILFGYGDAAVLNTPSSRPAICQRFHVSGFKLLPPLCMTESLYLLLVQANMATSELKHDIANKPVEILHLSMPRTGSISMMAAYRILGYTTYHGFDFIASVPHQPIWDRAVEGKFGRAPRFTKSDWESEEFLGPYQVLSDYPVLTFSAEFLEMWPDAKVVLVERDLDKWDRSFQEQVVVAPFLWPAWLLRTFIDPWLSARPATTLWKCLQHDFDCRDRESYSKNTRATYQRHYAWVKSVVPRENLLIYKLGSGWGPLCEFLGKDVPVEEFPWLNEGKEFELWMRKIQKDMLITSLKALARVLVIPTCILITAWALSRLHRRS